MFIVESYAVAIIMCFITMICWGSWANTTKLVSNKKWEFPLFYWDYSIGLLLCSLLFAFTLGSMGEAGRSFIPDIRLYRDFAVCSASNRCSHAVFPADHFAQDLYEAL